MKDVILLTGAGFTYNFGGFLGKDMWLRIFNNPLIQNHDRIRKLLLDDDKFDYESVYTQIIFDKDNIYNESEINAIKDVIDKVYNAQEYAVKDICDDLQKVGNFSNLKLIKFLMRILTEGDGKGFFFTLNHDWFIELLIPVHMPCISQQNITTPKITLPSDYNINELNCDIINNHKLVKYIKLHGSYRWLSSNQENAMVIGYNKLEDIQKEPLLWCYYQKFQEIINEGNKRLLIIGYSFRDEHINKVLQNGVRNHNLRLYVVDPLGLQDFKKKLYDNKYCTKDLWPALYGYFPYILKDRFTKDTIHDIEKDPFLNNILETLAS
jgi:hypothetical protein